MILHTYKIVSNLEVFSWTFWFCMVSLLKKEFVLLDLTLCFVIF